MHRCLCSTVAAITLPLVSAFASKTEPSRPPADITAAAANPARALVYTVRTKTPGIENHLLLRVNGNALQLLDAVSGAVLKTKRLRDISGVYIQGVNGETNDTLTIDFSGGDIAVPDGIHYDGGSGGYDSLNVTGGHFDNQHYEGKNANDGAFTLDQTRIVYTNLEPVTDTVSAASYTFTATNANETITISTGSVENGFQTMQIACPGLETVKIANKTSVTINAGGGNDTVSLNMTTAATGIQNLTVDGGGNVDGLNGTGDVFNLGTISVSGTVSLKGFLRMNDTNLASMNVTANALALRLVSAANTAGDVGDFANPIEIDVNTVACSGANNSGFFFLANSGSITVNTVDGIATSAGAGFNLTVTGGAITVAHNIAVFGGIDLTTVDAAGTGQNIVINANIAVSGSNSDNFIRAGDNFTLSTGASLNGGGGAFCIIQVDVGDADAATAGTVTLNGSVASGLGTVSVAGGPQGDTFNINNTTTSGRLQLNAGGGNDIYNLALGTITTGPGVDITETTGNGTDTLNLTGAAVADTFTTGAAAGGAPAGYVSITRTSGSGNSPAVSFDPAAVEAVNVNGADAGDSYIFNAANVAYTLAIADNGPTGSDSITLSGSANNDILNASGTQISRGNEVANFTGIEAVTVNGNNGSDTLNITPSATIPFTVAGGTPTPPTSPGDRLVVNVAGATNPTRSDASSASGFAGTYTFGNRQTITYSQIETRETTPPCGVACTNIVTTATAGSCNRQVFFNDPAPSDNCGTVTYSPVSGSNFPIGATTVTRTSSLGDSCTFTVTVNDVTPPSITCPANVVVDAAPGENSAVVNYPPPTANELCTGVTVVSTPASGSSFPVGTTTVTATATDGAGNFSSCTFSVTVNAVATPTPTPTATATPTPPVQPAQLGNISTRLRVQTGQNVLIGGFIITGSDDKKFIARAIGPSLGFDGALENPHLQIYNSEGGLVAENDNWQDSPNVQAILDSTIPPSHPLEAAVVETLAPAAYTALVSGVNGGTGVGLVEVYDLDQTVDSKLANISTRGFVETGNDVMIGGTIVLGQQPQNVIIRAIGPSLPVNARLQDPVLELYDGQGTILTSNDNWRDTQQSEIEATSIAPTDDREAAIVRTLQPGAYTAIVRGAESSTGVALVEVYALQ